MSGARLNELRRSHSEKLWFLAIGGFNTAFGYTIFSLTYLLLHRKHYLVALVVSHIVSVPVAFMLYRSFVFKVRGSVGRDLPRFWLVYLGPFILNLVVLPILVEKAGVSPIPAQAMILFVGTVGSYLGHKHFSFRRPVLELTKASR